MIYRTQCCGLREYSGLQDTPERTLKNFCRDMFGMGIYGTYFLFSGVSGGFFSKSAIDKLTIYIQKNKLGRVYKTGYKKNPNSGRRLKVIIFEPNMKRLKRWAGTVGLAVPETPRNRGGGGAIADWKIITVLLFIAFLVAIGISFLIVQIVNFFS